MVALDTSGNSGGDCRGNGGPHGIRINRNVATRMKAYAGGYDYTEQVQAQEAYVEITPQATISIPPDNEQAAKVLAHIPDWFFYTSLLVGAITVTLMILRYTPIGKPILKAIQAILRFWGKLLTTSGKDM